MPQPDVVFSEAAQALLAGAVVPAVYGVKVETASETLYLCQGDSFTDNTGQRWTGLGLFGSISGLQCGPEAATAPLQITLSGIVEADKAQSAYSSIASAIRDGGNEFVGRSATVYLLLFDAATHQPLDMPYMLQIYQMGYASFSYDGSSGAATLTVPADPLFGGKHIPPLNLVSDADQQARYPGDRIFERMGWRKTVITQ